MTPYLSVDEGSTDFTAIAEFGLGSAGNLSFGLGSAGNLSYRGCAMVTTTSYYVRVRRLPKGWRWFHAFDQRLEPPPPQPAMSTRTIIRRTQERYPGLMRARWKRRRFLQQQITR